ncbi:MAG: cation:proton antiporter [Gemmatimonadota bacterium]|nr:cation:proton antiporter [Gemmatimonadota bacterium]
MTHEAFTATLALIGIVILVASLLSGAVERTGLPLVGIFLLLGAMLGPAGLGLVELSLGSPTLQVIATLGLLLVLFSDAIVLDIGEVRRQRRLALLILGPGTLIPAALIALAAWWLLGLAPPAAAILGAALASTDPVLLRTLVRHPDLSPTARLALRLESGMNDVVLLPVVVLSMLGLREGGPAPMGEVVSHAMGLFILGPLLGGAIGYVAITLLDRMRRRFGVRRDYESLYALGVAFTAFAGAEAVGGSGFLAAFAAGLVIAALDVELCDCFLDYGEASAEIFLLFTFVAFGASLIWSGVAVADGRTLIFAAIALSVRTVVLLPVLARSGLDRDSRRIIAWFGPRGLSSLLLVLLPVFAGVPGAEWLFALTSLVVLLSVVLHGGGIALYLNRLARNSRRVERDRAPAAVSEPPLAGAATEEPERITVAELRRLWETGQPVVVADVRTERSFREDGFRASGSMRLPPDDAVRLARERIIPKEATLVLYCT